MLKAQNTPRNHSITLRVGETPIPEVGEIRILGLHLQANGHNGKNVQTVEKATQQITRIIARIANKHRGIQEKTLLKLFYAFLKELRT